jgi:NTE family protein
MQRRTFLKISTLAAPAVASLSYVSTAQAQGFVQKAQQISEKIFANDGLSIPIATTPTVSPLAKSFDRTLVLSVPDGRWNLSGFLYGFIAVVGPL